MRCRHAAKAKFMKLRSDVLVKLQLLDNKRGNGIILKININAKVEVTKLTLKYALI